MCSLLLLLCVAATGRVTSWPQEKAVVSLSAWCHGVVRVEGIRLCSDRWDNNHTQIVCQQMRCGDAVSFHQRGMTQSHVHHVHCNGSESNLGQCERDWGKCHGGLVSVNCTGRTPWRFLSGNCSAVGVKMVDNMPMCPDAWHNHIPNFQGSVDRCSGNLKMAYTGRQLSVCEVALKNKRDVRNAICRQLECGETGEYLEHSGPLPLRPEIVTHLSCSENSWTLLTCSQQSQNYDSCTLGGLRCYDWQKIILQHPTVPGTASEGSVFVDSQMGPRMVSNHGWTQAEGETLCRHLNLGGYKNHTTSELSSPMWVKSFNCSRVKEPQTIWDCESEERPSGSQGVYLQCQKSPEVTLSGNCSGEVKMDDKLVFSDHWDSKLSQLVCQELGCGSALHFESFQTESEVDAYQMNCQGSESKLEQCEAVLGHGAGQTMSVDCTDTVEFKPTEKCGGTLQVLFRKQWQQVCPFHLTQHLNNLLCKRLPGDCGEAIDDPTPHVEGWTKNMYMSLICKEDHLDIRDCVSKKPCKYVLPAEIYCQGYPLPLSTTEVTIIIIVTVLVIVTALILLFLFLRRKRRTLNLSRKSQKDKEVENKDVGDTANEMKALNDLQSRSEAAANQDLETT